MWNPDQYLRFRAERRRPYVDLMARVPQISALAAADLGCGPGHLSSELARRFPEAMIWAVDSSAEMIAKARAEHEGPSLCFVEADLASWSAPRPLDLIVANASLHWVPDHERLLSHLLGQLAAGGVLAVQMPSSFDEPSHRAVRAVSSTGPWAESLAGLRAARVEPLTWYVRRLCGHGLEVDAWETAYVHLMEGPGSILEWLTGTTLRPVLAALSPEEGAVFKQLLLDQLIREYPKGPGGSLLVFRRIFVVAQMPA